MRLNLFSSDYRWRKLAFLFLSTLLLLSFLVATSYGQVGWTNGHYYEFISMDPCNTTWADARDYAALQSYMGMQGHLATITSQAENDFIQSIRPSECNQDGSDTWIGGSQEADSSAKDVNWKWITGEPFNYLNWNTDEPNDDDGVENNAENCLEMRWSDGKWNDEGCDSGRCCFVVEYEPSEPIPTINELGMLILAAIIAASVIWLMWRRRRST